MATIVDFPGSRGKVIEFPARQAAAPTPSSSRRREFRPITATNPRNRYDAALKGHMSMRAERLIGELETSIGPWGGGQFERRAKIAWVIAQIRAIRDEVVRTTPEHHPPATC